MAKNTKMKNAVISKEMDAEATINPKPDESNVKKIRMREIRNDLTTPMQIITESKNFNRNYTVHEFKKLFPQNVNMWCVSEHYPHAKGGEVFVDYPRTPMQEKDCEKKREIMKKLGKRYAIVLPDMDDHGIAAQLCKE